MDKDRIDIYNIYRIYLLTKANFFLAFFWPGFFLSTLLTSRSRRPAIYRYMYIYNGNEKEEGKYDQIIASRREMMISTVWYEQQHTFFEGISKIWIIIYQGNCDTMANSF